ncbi:alanyl-tRNA editing protein [Conexibacter woesei]|uniref:Threonyl/alanyl tRNA synthetase SAD n=1 Tax=Conexibacter woesei (strain DSM 14684 / CCUG 47730 / CIP 108061 / JCM 11494 / NBRC 100937 / ID131577) TaxID=469383 RepID=D3FB52_CONWI|nr:alanyl-tRNA editing protein [Conexibacter woesei]ADB53244.1 Threonyl/alanyl tRNA synthetase SAD [Conexibacter woesei DSM 14684]
MSSTDATRAPADAPLYQVNAYQRSFSARVARAEGSAVQLEGGALFPGGGGQPADHGTLRSDAGVWQVTGAKLARDDSDPAFPAAGAWHLLDGEAPAAGTELEGELDWDRRYELMRTHTALHILCAVVWRDYGAKVTGANMEPLRGRMDFEFDALSGEFVRELEQKVNAEVDAARPTRVDFLPRADADRDPELIRNKVSLLPPSITVVRVVGIEGLDLQADGGTHVANTREVGRIALPSYKSKGKINKRVELTLEG